MAFGVSGRFNFLDERTQMFTLASCVRQVMIGGLCVGNCTSMWDVFEVIIDMLVGKVFLVVGLIVFNIKQLGCVGFESVRTGF